MIVDPHHLDLEIPVATTGGLLNIRAAPEFLRGDANRSGKVDLTDALVLLNHLFRGDPKPPCLDAADADDSGVVDVTDPIAILSHLFLGSGELPRPGTARCERNFGASQGSRGCDALRSGPTPVVRTRPQTGTQRRMS